VTPAGAFQVGVGLAALSKLPPSGDDQAYVTVGLLPSLAETVALNMIESPLLTGVGQDIVLTLNFGPRTVMVFESLAFAPVLSVTVAVIVYVPGAVYV
jgi:hypothetical protein